jgi:hypothetical protein
VQTDADLSLQIRDDGCQRMAVVGIARQGLDGAANWPPGERMRGVATLTFMGSLRCRDALESTLDCFIAL